MAWLLVVPLLLYIPFNLQRRMIAAVQVPLALLAAMGLQAWFARNRRGAARWGPVAYVAVACMSNLLLVAGSFGPITQRISPIYRPGAEIEALGWLDGHTQQDETVLASFPVGNVIPAWTDLRVFAGHGPETLHSLEKEAAVGRFFQPETDDAWRQSLLADFGIDYLFHGPAERATGGWEPATAAYLTPIYDGAGYAIYTVTVGGNQP